MVINHLRPSWGPILQVGAAQLTGWLGGDPPCHPCHRDANLASRASESSPPKCPKDDEILVARNFLDQLAQMPTFKVDV